jgi:hypothetical protein
MKQPVRIFELSALVLFACAAIRITSPTQHGSNYIVSSPRWVGVWQLTLSRHLEWTECFLA